MAVIGLRDPVEGDWGRLRGLQYSSLARLTFARLMAHAVAALLVLQTFGGRVHPALLVGWMALLVSVLISGARFDRSLVDADRRRVSRQEMHRQTISSLFVALAWALPMLVFGPFGDAAGRMTLWTVLAMLMTGMAVTFAAMPMATVLFSGVVGVSAVAAFLFEGEYTAAAVSTVFVVIVSVGAVEVARTFLGARVAEAGMAEKSEVVSLLLREFEEGDADWLWQVDANRRIRSVSPRFAFALGADPEDLEGKPLIQVIAGPAWEDGHFHSSLHDLAERLKRRESFSNLLVRATLHGSHRWWELSASPKVDDNGTFVGFRGVGSDVTEQRESAEKIAYLARYDTLTGLPNRLMLTEALGDAMGYSEKWRSNCAFLMIDLDRFKAVNDTLGHLVGDQLLAMVSDRMTRIIKDGEVCGRLGGDEFAVVVRDVADSQRIAELADAIIATLSQPYEVDHHMLYVGASVGSAIGPRDGATVETLLRNADLALYRAKDEGGGSHCTYEPALHAHAEERRKLEFSLRHALERSEFGLVFQPVVDATSEAVVSFEALLRWNSEEHGSVSPAKFIPLAEDTRLIVPIGEWVLRMACQEAMNWPPHVKIAVNVSGEQLLDPYFAETVVGALAASGLPPHRLEIEVTESIFVRDATVAQMTLENLMGIGCGVALDDFGTGYSSLGYLRKMRFSTIKVDRSFVQGAAKDNPESLAIVRAVVAMADSLDMSTTAEGVETEAELETIRRLGCKKIQGYYFGRPMSAADARGLFSQTRILERKAG
ncbi:diguanylate cyclase/phosphodiesterase with PAS/PAC sensor(s) [Novosphingobium aromaticivorans DSM 12444]|uniref:Diguanylate cyclase/phosphodiesterase with PAS/PAC sensor(S) n=1 Tax=Novosphingobium aromaticivorans (strain ATCC 700278 / DSM 12444 / CCUG 56034 / CIP 105152 / NBRC 16084 / F199) TaxID=279238 RepID=Q2G9J7_NOVAD|nr:GGDEF and EAL domain-containing protein [Novosphingobium aromaticivorans]ABD25476.1 diguanylate cyclase/phosphodiesterase with PAS/PAC sensor(s) [Novosphingobium aromaticivorans DSM 12444]